MMNSSLKLFLSISFYIYLFSSFSALNLRNYKPTTTKSILKIMQQKSKYEFATFGGGCFWCTEAIFSNLKGVKSVTAGYAGGSTKEPSYKDICSGETGHAEVIHITFDRSIITYKVLLSIFFDTHNPTTLNRQGADVGTQYRSVIFYHNTTQKESATELIAALTKEQVFETPIVTEITAFNNYYPAENYHQNYYENNKNAGYCRMVINPKLAAFIEKYKLLIKD